MLRLLRELKLRMPRKLQVRHSRLAAVRIDDDAVIDAQRVRGMETVAAELRYVVVLLDAVAADAEAADQAPILI